MATQTNKPSKTSFRPVNTFVEFVRSRFFKKVSSSELEKVSLFQEKSDYEVESEAQINQEKTKSDAYVKNFTHKIY